MSAVERNKRVLVWFRNDLRLHDNEMLVEAIAKSDSILPVYFFDPRQFSTTPYGTLKTGINRARFILESVSDLRASFRKLGGDLLLCVGTPESLIPELVQTYAITEVYHHREVASEETNVSIRVEDLLWKLKINLKHFIGHTLYNKEDLPFPIKDIPEVFTQFKKKTERDALVKPCFERPEEVHFVEATSWGDLPELSELFTHEPESARSSGYEVRGGEGPALQYLDVLLSGAGWTSFAGKKEAAKSRLSAWLSTGCLSPREVYWKLKEVENKPEIKNVAASLVVGLLWRDYFRFMFKKHGNNFFRPEGFGTEVTGDDRVDSKGLQQWKEGQTGLDAVDMAMKTLNEAGYIPVSERQLVALYLIEELKISWVLGAAYFEEKLVDYCPASNWGNWANIAGVGNDPRLAAGLSLEKILKTFHPKGAKLQTA